MKFWCILPVLNNNFCKNRLISVLLDKKWNNAIKFVKKSQILRQIIWRKKAMFGNNGNVWEWVPAGVGLPSHLIKWRRRPAPTCLRTWSSEDVGRRHSGLFLPIFRTNFGKISFSNFWYLKCAKYSWSVGELENQLILNYHLLREPHCGRKVESAQLKILFWVKNISKIS